MPFQFAIERVEYATGGETVLYGRVTAGSLEGPEWVRVATKNGSFISWTSGMEVSGPDMRPLTAASKSQISLFLENHPPGHGIIVPSEAEGLGEEPPAGVSLEQREEPTSAIGRMKEWLGQRMPFGKNSQ